MFFFCFFKVSEIFLDMLTLKSLFYSITQKFNRHNMMSRSAMFFCMILLGLVSKKFTGRISTNNNRKGKIQFVLLNFKGTLVQKDSSLKPLNVMHFGTALSAIP